MDFSLPSERVIRTLKQIISWRGKPLVIRCDNGPENISGTIQNWAKEWASGLNISSPASHSRTPMSNGSTGQFATSGYPSITGPALKRFRTSPRNGCGPTITTARIWPWAVSPQSSIWPWLHSRSTFRSSGNRGDYRGRRRTHTLSVCESQKILGTIDQWLPAGMGTRHGVLAPYAQRVHGLPGKTSLNSSSRRFEPPQSPGRLMC